MTYPDPDYGSITVNTDLLWDECYRPPLVMDAEIAAWKAVATGMIDDLLISSFMVRWRTRGIAGAAGLHLTAKGAEIGVFRPDGWADARYRPVVSAVEAAAFSRRAPAATIAVADSLLTGTQANEVYHAGPLAYCVIFYEMDADEAEFAINVLDYARPRGTTLCVIYSEVAKSGTFVLDSSELDGTHILANLAEL